MLNAAPIGLQAVPWTDFLEYTCRWAFGASGTTEVLREMTKGIFSGNRCSPGNRLHYDGGFGRFWTVNAVSTIGGTYKLKQFLIDISSSDPAEEKKGNCSDFAGLLHLALLSQGTSSNCYRYKTESGDGFHTWPLCPAGLDPLTIFPLMPGLDFGRAGNYHSVWLNFHMVVDHSGQTYDASNAYYFGLAGITWLEPVWGWSSTDYWQKSSHPHWGLAYSAGPFFTFSNTPYGVKSQAVPKTLTTGLSPTAIQ